ncbi:hypothetical protein ACFL0V_06240, partial [Nanoarchaeota archaeon]
KKLTLVKTSMPPGRSPFFRLDRQIYVNAQHPFFGKPDDFASHYGVLTTYHTAMKMKEIKIEDLILAQ